MMRLTHIGLHSAAVDQLKWHMDGVFQYASIPNRFSGFKMYLEVEQCNEWK